jgi:hypothetical protein
VKLFKLKTRLAACVLSLVAAGAPGAVQAAQAQSDSKPLLIVSVANVDKLMGNVDTLGTIAEARLITDALKAQALSQLRGLDTKRPLGVIVSTADVGVQTIGFVPVTDFAAFSKVIRAEAADGGIARIERAPVPVFVKEHNKWAFFSDNPDALATLPDDPVKLLAGQEKEYDVAVRGFVQNVPDEMRKLAVEAAKSGVDFAEPRPGESDADFEIRKQAARGAINQIVTFVEETDRVTLGWLVDAEKKKAQLDVNLVARSGSKLARDLGQLASAKSRFGGFLLPGAAATLNVSAKQSADQIQQTKVMLKTGKERILQSIENDSSLPNEEARKLIAEVFNQAWDVLEKTVDEGVADGAAALLAGPSSLTFVSGAHVADGQKLEAAAKRVLELAKSDPDFKGEVKFDAETHGDVRLHTIAVPITDPEPAKVLGDSMDIVLGFGPKAAYLSFGKDAAKTLKSAIDDSVKQADRTIPPGQFTLAIGPILHFAAAASDDPNLAGVLKLLTAEAEKYEGRDRLIIGIRSIENGVGYRVELEQGLIALAGKTVAMFAGRAAGGRGF